MRAQIEMIRVDAGRDIAAMQHHQTWRDQPAGFFPGQPGDPNVSPFTVNVAD
jgi:hypothetical protein